MDKPRNNLEKVQRIRPWIRVLMFYIVVLAIIYWPVLDGVKMLKTAGAWPPGPLFVGDPIAGGAITLPMERLALIAWRSRQLPLWLPFQGLGLTLAGNQGNPWFLPEVLLHMMFPNNYSVWNVVRLLLLAFGAYLFSREFKISVMGSTLVGLFMVLAGPTPPNINMGMLNPLMLLPYVLLATVRLAKTRVRAEQWLWSVVLAALTLLMFLSGFDEVLPLFYLLDALVFGLILIRYSGSWKEKVAPLLLWMGACFVGLVGSAVATVNLLVPLKSYFSYQSSSSYLYHVMGVWLITLVDPYFFGEHITAGAYDMGQTIWVLGNPMLWPFVGSAAIIAMRKRSGQSTKPLVWLFVTLVIFGSIAYADLLGSLNIFAVPPFNLIVMVRMLPFLWWLPACVLAGYGYDAYVTIEKPLKSLLIGTILVTPVIWYQFMNWSGSSVYPISSHAGFHTFLSASAVVFAFTLMALIGSLLLDAKRLQRLVWALACLSLIALVPKNFFWAHAQGDTQAQAAGQYIAANGLASGLYFTSGSENFGTLLSSENVRVINAFGVFYPSSYATALESLFPSANPTAPGNILFLGSPTLYSLPLNTTNIKRLSLLGVSGILSQTPLVKSSKTLVVHARSLPAPLSTSTVKSAVTTLALIYDQRSDLQTAFNSNSTSFTRSLLQWAVTSGTTYDSAHVKLAPFRSDYQRLLAMYVKMPSLPALWKGKETSLFPGVHLLRQIMIPTPGEPPVYLYRIANSSPLIWNPSSVKSISGNSTSVWSNQPTHLLRTVAFVNNSVPQSYLGAQSRFRTQLINFKPGEQFQNITVRANRPGTLVLRLQYTKHQEISVNGRKVNDFPVDGLFTGFHINGGISKIRANYFTPLQVISWWLTVAVSLALAVALAFLTVLRIQTRRKKSDVPIS